MRAVKRYFPIFVVPTLIAFVIAFVVPFVMGLVLSFCNFRTVSDAEFIGIGNYIRIFTEDDTFLNSLWFTVRYAIVSVVTINVLAFTLALMLSGNIFGTKFFRTVFFMPNLIGGIVLGYIWQLIINGVLYKYGAAITTDARYGFWGLVILMNWQMIGYMMIIYIAGLSNISTDILEAARVDGAGYFTTLFKVTIPSVMPSITICLFLTITNAFKLFDQNLALTAGAPAGKTRMLALDIYETFYGRVGNEGLGQAKSVIFFLIVAAASLSQLILTRRKEVES
jgi:raffinose/stachyose/melibiose transport system permease protein